MGVLMPPAEGGWPAATLLVNVVGSLLLGAFLARRQSDATVFGSLEFWAIGVLGSLTTFSALSIEVVRLADQRQFVIVFGYVALSVFGGLGAAILGGRLAGVRA